MCVRQWSLCTALAIAVGIGLLAAHADARLHTGTTNEAQGVDGPPTLQPFDDGRVPYFIADGEPGSQYRPADRELAVWALREWERTLGGGLKLEPGDERDALLRVYWVPASAGQYGEMRALRVNGRRGAAVYIRPDTDALGPDIARLARQDALLRDTIVYLTCLHELGHAFGLSHTASVGDIMYFFGYGGDIPGFFRRYREKLSGRADIATVSGLSASDISRLRALYPTTAR